MTRRYGGKATLALSFLLWSPASMLMVFPSGSSDHALSGFIACRLVIGMAQGMLVPASQSVLGHWVPPESRGRYFALAMAGKFAGATIAMVTVPIVGKERRGRRVGLGGGEGTGGIIPVLDDFCCVYSSYIQVLHCT